MVREWTVKSFKSGNSIALRLPKALGIGDGEEVVLVPHDDGSFTFWKKSKELDILMGLYGAFSPGFMSEGRGDIEQAERDWNVADSDQAA